MKASIDKLLSSGILEVGAILELRGGMDAGQTAQVLEGGSLRLEDGTTHKSPSGAALNRTGFMQARRFVCWPVGLSVVDCSTRLRIRRAGCARGLRIGVDG